MDALAGAHDDVLLQQGNAGLMAIQSFCLTAFVGE
jgi:hypothetical protein